MKQFAAAPARAGVSLPSWRARGLPAIASPGRWLLLAIVLLALAASASAQTFPKLTGRVVDEARLLRPEQVLDISSKSEALEAQSGAQLVVVTVPSLGGQRIEDYSYQLGRHWGIGQKDKDNGVLLVVAPKERKVWIATGYEARIRLTDAVASIIYRNAIVPRFKAGDYGGGITAGVDEIVKVMRLSPEEAQRQGVQAERAERNRELSGAGFIPVVLWMIAILFVITVMARGARGRRYRSRRASGISPWIVLWGLNELSRGSRRGGWGGGSWGGGGWGGGGFGGGGGFSGGGGSFGGGGAGGSW